VIRIVEVDGYDWSPCGGTHLAHTGQIRTLKILSLERYKGKVRLYFIAGSSAVKFLAQTYEIAKKAALLYGTTVQDLYLRVKENKEKQALLEQAVKRQEQLRAKAEVANALIRSPHDPVLYWELAEENTEWAMALCKATAENGRTAIAYAVKDCTVVVQAPQKASANGGTQAASDGADPTILATAMPSLSTVLKPLMLQLGGKGGGSESFFRAQFATHRAAEECVAQAQALLRAARSL